MRQVLLVTTGSHLWGNTAKGASTPGGKIQNRTDNYPPSSWSGLLIFSLLSWQETYEISFFLYSYHLRKEEYQIIKNHFQISLFYSWTHTVQCFFFSFLNQGNKWKISFSYANQDLKLSVLYSLQIISNAMPGRIYTKKGQVCHPPQEE